MSRARLTLLFFGLLAVYVAGNWALPLVDRDEPRFAEASREMIQRGDYVVPYFNNVPRYDKPPLIYWMQVACYKALGINEFSARLPSGVCAALAAVLVALWGAQMYGENAGWRAGVMFGLCVQTILHAHAAVADMAMIASSTGAGWAGWNWLEAKGGQKWRWWLAFWGLLGIGFLAKGPIAWVPIGMAGWASAKVKRDRRPGVAGWMLGAMLMLGIVGCWGVPALMRTHGEFAVIGLGKHVVGRSMGPMQGHGAKSGWVYVATIPYYLVTVWVSFFPWALWMGPAGVVFWRKRREWSVGERYMAAGIFLVFGIFTLSWTKLPHYTLPAFPMLAIVVASWGRMDVRRWGWGMACGGVAVGLIVFPLMRGIFVSRTLYRACEQWVTPEMEMGALRYEEPSLVWLFRGRMRGYEKGLKERDVAEWMQRPGGRICIVPAERRGLVGGEDPNWKVLEAKGLDIADGKRVDLVAIIKLK